MPPGHTPPGHTPPGHTPPAAAGAPPSNRRRAAARALASAALATGGTLWSLRQSGPAASDTGASPEAPEEEGAAPATPPPAPAPQPVEVAAYYFPNYHREPRNEGWYGEGWTEWELVKAARPRFPGHRQPLVPAWGYFDEADPMWAASQITLAADHGITAFLYDWYWYEGGPFLQRALEDGFLAAPENRRLKFALMWANHDWLDIQPASAAQPLETLMRGAVSAEGFERLTDYVVERYFTRANYLALDGLPYFSIYELSTFVKGLGDVSGARAALDRFRAKARALGFPGIHLNGIVWGGGAATAGAGKDPAPLPDTVQLARDLGLSSVASYTWFHHHDPSGDRFPRASYAGLAGTYGRWTERCRRFPLDYHPNVTMGWDPSPRTVPEERYERRGYPWTAILEGNTPDRFRAGLEAARAYLSHPQPSGAQQRLVTLNAWNEWTEGSYLLPEAATGTAYLEAVRDVFRR